MTDSTPAKAATLVILCQVVSATPIPALAIMVTLSATDTVAVLIATKTFAPLATMAFIFQEVLAISTSAAVTTVLAPQARDAVLMVILFAILVILITISATESVSRTRVLVATVHR